MHRACSSYDTPKAVGYYRALCADAIRKVNNNADAEDALGVGIVIHFTRQVRSREMGFARENRGLFIIPRQIAFSRQMIAIKWKPTIVLTGLQIAIDTVRKNTVDKDVGIRLCCNQHGLVFVFVFWERMSSFQLEELLGVYNNVNAFF